MRRGSGTPETARMVARMARQGKRQSPEPRQVGSSGSGRGGHGLQPPASATRPILLGLIMAAIFAADTITHYEIAIPVLYTVVLLGAAFSFRPRNLIWLACLCLGLTGVSFAFTLHGNAATGAVNLLISSAAIVITAWLAIRLQHAREMALQGQSQLARIAHAQMVSGLTSSIVHELNQPLAAIATSGQACQRWLSATPPNVGRAEAALERIIRDTTRAADILTRMKDLTRGKVTECQRFNLADAAMDVVAMAQHRLEHHDIAARIRCKAGTLPAWGDPVQIQQVVSNLLLNAIEAIAAQGTGGGHIEIALWKEDNACLCRVSDDGAGIAPTLTDHLFEPFWSTKQEGTGIGLAISRTLIEANKGRIWLAQDRREGAAFCFSIPAACEEEA
ncbi:sensor histidine kinase [Asaia bogorensis]|uniref:histidine kinase n=1 Tax=Asaia bogorensis NBRC 16594 TaxID=1231624 RepID=A0AAN4R3L0_9PROT|nr:HAMP domain-containing sensor histidine kinase [Asaia bogorensis]GBQ76167.1 signal transduction histidine kinase [Asaia bogorensis NBRC 16594]GEL53720.1 two component sensor kinase [Asaia bogorensis NBRC 16594]